MFKLFVGGKTKKKRIKNKLLLIFFTGRKHCSYIKVALQGNGPTTSTQTTQKSRKEFAPINNYEWVGVWRLNEKKIRKISEKCDQTQKIAFMLFNSAVKIEINVQNKELRSLNAERASDHSPFNMFAFANIIHLINVQMNKTAAK